MRTAVTAAAVCLSIVGLSVAEDAGATMKRQFTNIPAQGLGPALQILAQQREFQVVYLSDSVDSLRTVGAVGEMTSDEALTQLLSGTGLTFRYLEDNTVTIFPSTSSASAGDEQAPGTGEGGTAQRGVRVAQNDSQGSQDSDTNKDGKKSASSDPQSEDVSSETSEDQTSKAIPEIVVTGTRIHGRAPAGSQIVVVDREEIYQSGHSTTQDVIRTLPQNFGGGVSEDTVFSGEGATNATSATAVNLRGLGSSATLTLLEGRRIAPSGGEGSFVDISNIPLSAVERIEVLPDGASSLYGSDAIAGVVNIVLRKDFDGSESTLQYGETTNGPLRETLASHLFGKRWQSGSVLISAEYYDRHALPNSARRQAQSDLTAFGGDNFDTDQCNAGTLIANGVSYAIPSDQDGTGLVPADFSPNTRNLCDRNSGAFLLPDQERWNVLGRIRQRTSASFELFLDTTFGQRDAYKEFANKQLLIVPSSNAFYVNPAGGSDPVFVLYDALEGLGPRTSDIGVEFANVALGAELELGQWNGIVYVGDSREKVDSLQLAPDSGALAFALADSDPTTAFNAFADGVATSPSTLSAVRSGRSSMFGSESASSYASAVFDGPIAGFPAGGVLLAVGAEFRREEFETELSVAERSSPFPLFSGASDLSREVKAVFGELSIPLVNSTMTIPLVQELTISMSGRYEDYSDFGSESVPRFGLTWRLNDALSLRASWADSYKAPRLAQLDETNLNFAFQDSIPNPEEPSGFVPVLVLQGQNSALQPETATTWTAGFDIQPAAVDGLRVSATFFSIDFTDRIEAPFDYGTAFLDPAFTGTVVLDPTSAQLVEACTHGQYVGNFSGIPGDCDEAAVFAIVDARSQNVSALTEEGVDASVNYNSDLAGGNFGIGVAATKLLDFIKMPRAGAQGTQLVDTQENPIDLKLRAFATWSLGPWNVASFINYADDYEDQFSTPNRAIGSWTTVDLSAGYRLGEQRPLTFTLSVTNAFDELPPFYNNFSGVGYDPQNADLTGRVVRLGVRKAW